MLFEEDEEFVFGEAALFAGVAVAEGDGAVFFDRVEVDGDAEGGADFVLAAIAATDRTGGVVEDVPSALESFKKSACAFDQFGLVFQQREDGSLVGSDAGWNLSRVRFSALPLSLGTSSSV